jgi:hypothetical protein
MGKQEGEDGHDVIEALAKMDWSVATRNVSDIRLIMHQV